jgi:hypothetical protein
MQALELAGERQIAIKDRSNLYRFTLAPITREMWLQYFDGIVSTSENRNREQLNTFDVNSSLLALVHDALTGAEGYKSPAEGKISDLAGWKELLPFSHRLAIGQILALVVPLADAGDDEAIALGFDSVQLSAPWNCDVNGVMLLHQPLVHHFGTPSFEHERRYLRDQAKSKVIGGSRTGKTAYMGTQRALVEIYDELIQSVEGYTINGQPVEDPAQWMDTYHKVVAAAQLFKAPPAEPEEAVEAA